jgi:metal-responsive CopG/Arc/MetJ family transcriptional regulator
MLKASMNYPTAKTAVSLPQELLEKTDKIAQENGTSRSAIVAEALAEYIHRRENEQILAQLNEVYDDEPLTLEESNTIEAGMTYVAKNVLEQW